MSSNQIAKLVRAVDPGRTVLPIPNFKIMPEADKARFKALYRTRFASLRKALPNVNIPNVEDSDDLYVIHSQYEVYWRHFNVVKSAQGYKNYLLTYWAAIELIGCKYFGLNLTGFTTYQESEMEYYEQVLMELGEDSFGSFGADWPPIVKIIFFSITSAVTFWVINYISDTVPILKPLLQSRMNGQMSSAIATNDNGAGVGEGFAEPPGIDGQQQQGGIGGIVSGLSGLLSGNGGEGGLAGLLGGGEGGGLASLLPMLGGLMGGGMNTDQAADQRSRVANEDIYDE